MNKDDLAVLDNFLNQLLTVLKSSGGSRDELHHAMVSVGKCYGATCPPIVRNLFDNLDSLLKSDKNAWGKLLVELDADVLWQGGSRSNAFCQLVEQSPFKRSVEEILHEAKKFVRERKIREKA
ncbi:hypothetical protein KJ853_02160 [Patescibacteria group bacterium]|nr:hypothetical protein [Patescibacteria group bacterium]